MKDIDRFALHRLIRTRRLIGAVLVASLLAACCGPAPIPTTGAPTPSSLPALSPYPGPTISVGQTAYPGPSLPSTPAPSLTANANPQSTMVVYLPMVVNAMSTPVVVAVAPTPLPSDAPPPPPPTPQWPDPIAGQTASKLGLHVIRDQDYAYAMEFVRRVHPRVMKVLGEVHWLADVKAASPDTVTIGRYDGQEETWVGSADPVAAADAYVTANLERYQRNPGVDYWEGWNEYNPSTPASWEWYAQFEAERACVMQAHGLRAAVGTFGVGWPNTYDQMGLFLPALEAAHRCGAIWTLHEYNSPTFQCGVSVDVPGVIPGAPQFPGVLVGYHTLRYRIWYEGYLKPRGLGDLPLVISELGIQGLAVGGPCNDPGGGDWKDYRDWWVQHGYGVDWTQAYLNVLAWYDAEIRKDPYVIGAAIFTLGAPNPANDWHGFDLHDVLPALTYYEASQQ